MDILNAILLGLIQGLTEFLPVSSSGHIELGKAILGSVQETGLDFSILVHVATALSTVIVFRKDIGQLLQQIFAGKREALMYAAMLIASAVPVAVVGLGFKDQLEALFEGRILLVGCMLLVTALLLYLTIRVKKHDKTISFKEALMMGLAQTVAILPGISRSGATIATALLMRVDKEEAARFSFLMVLIPIFGQALLDGIDFASGEAAWELDTGIAIAGFLAAFLSGLFACTAMLRIVKRGKLFYFSIYCAIVGLIAIITSLI
ncbi:MAG: undecaprenyl-diphosphate phosphatase [Bacteroidota bacterium]